MKYLVMLYDGMSDLVIPQLNNQTPLEYACVPLLDELSSKGTVGLLKTVQDDMKPGSDVANLSVLGYDPKVYYTGRSPLEAGSIGIVMNDTDVALRCNLVTVSDNDESYSEKILNDYCSGDISTADAKILVNYLKEYLDDNEFTLYSGVSYRHCLIWGNGTTDVGTLTPPHDITGKPVRDHLPNHPNALKLLNYMERSHELLKSHPLNLERVKQGKSPANCAWLWGEGKRAALTPFCEKFGLKGSMISAVDLLKGIGKFAEMNVVLVDGATGYIDTNFEGKGAAAISEFKSGQDLVYVHVEAPDECGHRGETQNKVKAIELITERVLNPIYEYLKNSGNDFKILVTPDHATPISLKTHTNAPVPFFVYNSANEKSAPIIKFCEKSAAVSGLFIEDGATVMQRFISEF